MIRLLKILILISLSEITVASELIYQFQNPDFIGGNPLNGQVLLNEANAQNIQKAPVKHTTPTPALTPMEKMSKSIETGLLNAVASADVAGLKKSLVDPVTGYIYTNLSGIAISGGYTISTSPGTASDGVVGTVDITITDTSGKNTPVTISMPDVPTKF